MNFFFHSYGGCYDFRDFFAPTKKGIDVKAIRKARLKNNRNKMQKRKRR